MGRAKAPRPPAALPGAAEGTTVEPKLRGLRLPPLTVAGPAGGWTHETAWTACRDYAARIDHGTASPEGLAHAAWLALSRAVDRSLGVTAASPHSLVRQEIEARLGDPEPTFDAVAYALAIDPPPF